MPNNTDKGYNPVTAFLTICMWMLIPPVLFILSAATHNGGVDIGRNDMRNEAVLRGVATYTVDTNGVATFSWLVPIKAEKQ